MPKGVAKSGIRLTKKRREAFASTDPDLLTFLEPKGYQPLYKNTPPTLAPTKVETEEEILERLTQRFDAMQIMTDATARGVNRSFIISGPAGLGKSFEVEQTLDALGSGYTFSFVKGHAKATGLYKKLYENRHENCTVVFDDCDSIFADETSLNFLKTACDTTEKRVLSYLAEIDMQDCLGQAVPTEFEFKGSIIFITNYKMDDLMERGHKYAMHFEALISRSHYLDLGMDSNRDYIVRIKQVMGGGMLASKGFTRDEERRVLDYIIQKQDKLRELSLRMVLKLAGLLRMSPNGWMNLAEVTCCKR